MQNNYFNPLGGHFISIQVPTPAPGNEWAYNIPTRSWLMPLSIEFTFTADATIASRELRLVFTVAPATITPFQLHRAVTASQIMNVCLSANLGFQMAADRNNFIIGALPWPIIMSSSQQITTVTDNLQAGDLYDSITIHGRRWIDASY